MTDNMDATTTEPEPNHETPEGLLAWAKVAQAAIPEDDAKVLAMGPVNPAGKATYASRRVLFGRPEVGGTFSRAVIAGDEPNEAATHVTVDGVDFWPYTVNGCYPCTEACNRHGPMWGHV